MITEQDIKRRAQELLKSITSEQAQSIINIACTTWKSILADNWGRHIVQGNKVDIPELFYQEMRKACTSEQNELFDEIFCSDEIKKGDWVTIIGGSSATVFHKGNDTFKVGHRSGTKWGKGEFVCEETKDVGNGVFYGAVRLATPEEIKKTQYYPDGTPCLAKHKEMDAWGLRYADGNGYFYCDGKKSGRSIIRQYHMKLDITNLPVNN